MSWNDCPFIAALPTAWTFSSEALHYIQEYQMVYVPGSDIAFDDSEGTRHYHSRDDDGDLFYHRANGPAREFRDGYVDWWLYGNDYNFEAWLAETPASDEEKVMLKLVYG